MKPENPYQSPKEPADDAPAMSAREDQRGTRKRVRTWFLWVFPIAWNAPLVITLICAYVVYKPLGPWGPEELPSPEAAETSIKQALDAGEAFERALYSVAVIQGWLLALMSYALLLSAKLHRLVFQPWVTRAEVRAGLLACGLLWTVLPAIAVVFLYWKDVL